MEEAAPPLAWSGRGSRTLAGLERIADILAPAARTLVGAAARFAPLVNHLCAFTTQ